MFQSAPPVKAATHPLNAPTVMLQFQSAPPVKAATHYHRDGQLSHRVSIRAAGEGGDNSAATVHPSGSGFNPRRR